MRSNDLINSHFQPDLVAGTLPDCLKNSATENIDQFYTEAVSKPSCFSSLWKEPEWLEKRNIITDCLERFVADQKNLNYSAWDNGDTIMHCIVAFGDTYIADKLKRWSKFGEFSVDNYRNNQNQSPLDIIEDYYQKTLSEGQKRYSENFEGSFYANKQIPAKIKQIVKIRQKIYWLFGVERPKVAELHSNSEEYDIREEESPSMLGRAADAVGTCLTNCIGYCLRSEQRDPVYDML